MAPALFRRRSSLTTPSLDWPSDMQVRRSRHSVSLLHFSVLEELFLWEGQGSQLLNTPKTPWNCLPSPAWAPAQRSWVGIWESVALARCPHKVQSLRWKDPQHGRPAAQSFLGLPRGFPFWWAAAGAFCTRRQAECLWAEHVTSDTWRGLRSHAERPG